MKPAVVVLGASGQVGLFTVAGLLEAGCEVLAVTRRPADGPATGIEGLRRFGLAQVIELLNEAGGGSGFRALLSCGPVAVARELLDTEPRRDGGVWQRAVVVGTTSTRSKRASTDEGERRTIAEIETALAAIRQRSGAEGIPLTVLHPTLIYGCGMDQNLTRIWRWIRRFGFAPIAAEACGLRQALHVADLADTMIMAVQAEPALELESPVCGGSTLEYREMVGLLFDAAHRKRRFLRLPKATFGAVAALSSLLPGAGRITREMFARQSQDLVFDDGPARAQLGHAPRSFQPSEADFRLPAAVQAIRQALR